VGGRIEVPSSARTETYLLQSCLKNPSKRYPKDISVLEKISSLAAVSFLVAEANMTSNGNDCCTASHQRTRQLLVTAIVFLEGENVLSFFVVFAVGSPMVFGHDDMIVKAEFRRNI
jgi:hypothetical protein